MYDFYGFDTVSLDLVNFEFRLYCCSIVIFIFTINKSDYVMVLLGFLKKEIN